MRLLLLLLPVLQLMAMTEEQSKTAFPALQAAVQRLPELPVSAAAPVAFTTLELNLQPVVGGDHRVDGIRVRVPLSGGDLVWAFALPRTCLSWYIIPATGASPGFTGFLRAGHWSTATWPSDPSYRSFLQTLPSEHLQPGRDYILWFEFSDAAPASIHAAIRFQPPPADGWSRSAITTALGLEDASLDQRSERFATRGARLLRDGTLVEQPFGSFRLHTLLNHLDGADVAIATAPGRLPRLAEVVQALGEPDLALDHDPLLAAGQTRIGTGLPQAGDAIALRRGHRTVWYDFVALTYAANGKRATDLTVLPWDAARSASRHGGDALDRLPGDVVVLHRDRVLTAVLRDLGERDGACSWGEVPAATWRGRDPAGWVNEELVCDGGGDGALTVFSLPGVRGQFMPLTAWRFHGEATGWYDGTRKRAVVTYRDGVLDGDAVWFAPDGSESARARYADGKRIDAPADP